MMNFLLLCRATIQHQRVNKGGYRFIEKLLKSITIFGSI